MSLNDFFEDMESYDEGLTRIENECVQAKNELFVSIALKIKAKQQECISNVGLETEITDLDDDESALFNGNYKELEDMRVSLRNKGYCLVEERNYVNDLTLYLVSVSRFKDLENNKV
jgi:hypothetical protein